MAELGQEPRSDILVWFLSPASVEGLMGNEWALGQWQEGERSE